MRIVGMDLGKFKTSVCVMEEDGTVRTEKVVETTRKALGALLSKVPGAKVAMETTFNCGWVTDLARSMGHEVHVGHTKYLKAISQAKSKTDRIDARKLAHLVRAGYFPDAYVPAPEVRSLRAVVRQRAFLVRSRTRIKNRIHMVLAETGERCPEEALFGKAGRAWLEEAPLDSLRGENLKQLLVLLDFLDGQITKISRRIDRLGLEHPAVKRLETLPGIGRYGAMLIACEVDRIERFDSPQRFCSYAGLVPTVSNSGNSVRIGHLSKEGNRWLKWILVEAAQHAWRSTHPYHAFYSRMKRRKGSRIARIAVARRIAESVYWMLTRNEDFRCPTERKEACQSTAVPA